MFQTAKVTYVDVVNNLIQIQYTKSGTLFSAAVPATFGNALTGIQYVPNEDDVVFIDDTDGFHVYVIGCSVSADKLKNGLVKGELLIFNQAGAMIKLTNDGSIYLIPALNKPILIGQGPMQPVARNGDTVTGTDNHGNSFTGVIHSSTSTLLSS